MNEVTNLQALRAITGNNNGQLYYVKGHTNSGDGGGGVFMWRTGNDFKPKPNGNGNYAIDNNGTVIETTSASGKLLGRWVRQYEGYINVLFFGAFGKTQDYTTAFQNALDFAALNAKNDPELKGSVVYIPNGNYRINQLILKSGISILGESLENTLVQTTENHNVDYMIKMDIGPVFLNISNIKFFGRRETQAGCFFFEAMENSDFHGGLWNSFFKNIQISGFKGNGIYLKGGSANGLTPNQFNTFENVRVGKDSDFSNSLKMEGQNGQHTFLNCTFDGFNRNNNNIFPKGQNVHISHSADQTTGILSFINCTFQEADYGIYMNYAENINIDSCWFESLGVAITINGSSFNSCRDITIQNNRFANAAGYGSMIVDSDNIKTGQCISISNSFVNVYNNYVSVTKPNDPNLSPSSKFLIANNNTLGGVAIADNVFQNKKLGKTFGVMQVINVQNSNTLAIGRNKLVFVNASSTVIKIIESSINASETITIRANGGSISFDNTENIFLTNKSSFSLANGEIAVFVKIDNIVGNYDATYQLLSVMRTNTP